ncbi:MAG: hypothetical protein ACYTFO_06215 [Planctomycetota bacterium]|jgi:hypothetical protein
MEFLGQQTVLPVSIISVIVPIALYFLVLGLLNSRSRPQLLRSTEDALLLIGSVALVFVPLVIQRIGASATAVVAAFIGVAAVGWLLVARPAAWIVYNSSGQAARAAVTKALTAMGCEHRCSGETIDLSGGGHINLRHVPLLRNTSVRLTGRSHQFAHQLEQALSGALNAERAEPNPAAAACVLIATAMLIVPLALAAHRADEIVRLITGLLP